MDYKKFYHLEKYLFEEVGPKYRKTGKLSAGDLLCILIWKSNRSKTKTISKLGRKAKGNIYKAVSLLAKEIKAQASSKGKLSVLIESWGLRLPTASAILTVLYPDVFTVYDKRVCDILDKFHGLADKKFEGLWHGYEEFIQAVRNAVPNEENLRNKDRYLWGRSFYLDMIKTLKMRY